MIKTPNERANEIALKQRFLDRAKALSNLAEVFRCPQVTLLICETVAFGVGAEAEIFQAAYGDPIGRKYWDAALSEPMPVYSLAHILSVHVAEKAEQLEMATIAIIRAFRDAAEAGERWFTGDTSLLLAMEYGQTNFENLGGLKVHPRAAVEWLLSKPKREHLVPQSLRRFLQSAGELTNANANAPTAPRPVTQKIADKSEQPAGRSPTLVGLEAKKVAEVRPRRRRAIKLEQTKEKMRCDIREGRQTAAALNDMLEKKLASTYGISRDTARKARNAVLSELGENSIPDK